jgi:hypothetical protein
MSKLELFIELTRRRLAFKIIALLTRHNELLTSELIIMLDHRYSEESIKRAITYLLRNDLIRKIRRGHSRIIMLNAENEFVTKLTNFVRTLHEKDLWNVFEETFLGTGSRIKAVMALMNGAMVKTELSKASRVPGGAPTDLMLKPLISHEIVIEHRGRRRVEYELNKDNPLVQVLTEYLRTIGVINNGNNNKNREFYAKLAREFVDYVIGHWDDYIINPYRRNTIKLTGPVIRSFLERRGAKLYPGWFVDFVVEEFKRRGFCVMVKKFGQRPNIIKVKVYVSKTCDGGES